MENNMKKIFALILTVALLVFMVACDDDNVGGVEIDVSGGGFFDDPVDTTDSDAADTAASTDDTADTDSDTEDASDTEAAE